MELALVIGRGPELVTDLEGRRPLPRDEDVVVFGVRDADHAAAEGSQPLARPSGPSTWRRSANEAPGGRPATPWPPWNARTVLGPPGCRRPRRRHQPSVDYHLTDGLTWEELTSVLRTAVASDQATGLDITIFNPTLDPDGRVARSLVDALVAALTP